MRTFLTLMLLATLQTQTSFAFAQGVRDRCAAGECGGGEISPWFYAFLLGIFLLVAFYKLFWGSESEHKEALNSLFTIVKLAFLFIGIPIVAFIIFGGKDGDGGKAAIISFFAIGLVFGFTEKLSKWAVGGRGDDSN